MDAGTIDPHRAILTGKLYVLRTLGDFWIVVCSIAYVFFTIRKTWRLVRETTKACRSNSRRRYFTVWMYIDWSIVLVSYAGVVTYVFRQLAIEMTMRFIVGSDHRRFISFYMIAYWDYAFTCLGSAALCLSIVNLLKIINLSQHISKVQSTIRQAFKHLLRASVALVATFVLFICIALLTLGPSCRTYSTLPLATMNVFNLCLCRMRNADGDCVNVDQLATKTFFVVVGCSVLFVWVPVTRALFISTHFDTVTKVEALKEEGELFKFIWYRLHVWVGAWTTKMYRERIVQDARSETERRRKVKKRIELRETIFGEHIRTANKVRWNI